MCWSALGVVALCSLQIDSSFKVCVCLLKGLFSEIRGLEELPFTAERRKGMMSSSPALGPCRLGVISVHVWLEHPSKHQTARLLSFEGREIKPRLEAGRTTFVLEPFQLQSKVHLVLQVIWKGGSWLDNVWNVITLMELLRTLKLISRHPLDGDACRSQTLPSWHAREREVFRSAYFALMYISWHPGSVELLDIFQQSQTFWSQEPHPAFEGTSCVIWRDNNPRFHLPTKMFGTKDERDQQGFPKTGTEGKSLCKYLVHKLPCLKVTIQSSAAKHVGVEEFSRAPACWHNFWFLLLCWNSITVLQRISKASSLRKGHLI